MGQILLFFLAIGAGFLGALLGIGGGMILTPVLTTFFGIPLPVAIATSMISVIATSSGAAAAYVRDHLTNVRLAVFLEVATTLGALIGVFLALFFTGRWLYFVFSAVLLQSVFMMAKGRSQAESGSVTNHPWALTLRLNSSYPEYGQKQEIPYQVSHVPWGFILMVLAGTLSSLLGIGSGALKVLAMDRAMKLPLRVSSATSNFMIGVTASVGAWAFYSKGLLRFDLSVPVALGVLLGSFLGSKAMVRIQSQRLRQIFLGILVILAIQMLLKGIGVL